MLRFELSSMPVLLRYGFPPATTKIKNKNKVKSC